MQIYEQLCTTLIQTTLIQNTQTLQCSVENEFKGRPSFNSSILHSSFHSSTLPTVKDLLKLMYICQSYSKIISETISET